MELAMQVHGRTDDKMSVVRGRVPISCDWFELVVRAGKLIPFGLPKKKGNN